MNEQPHEANQQRGSRHKFSLSEIGIADQDLRLEIFALCDSAIERQGRLSLLGSYEIIYASQFPFVLPPAAVVLRVRFWPAESREQSIGLVLTGSDGHPASDFLKAQVSLRPFCGERSAAYNVIVQLDELRIQRPGEHTFDFYLNGKLEGRLPLCVFSAPTPTVDY